MKNTIAKPGDLVFITMHWLWMPWIQYKHYGIVASNGEVYHFNNNPNCKFSKTHWDLFAQNYQVYVLDIDGHRVNTILGRAEMLEKIDPQYYLHKGNCEHTALFCKTREWKSEQVRRLLFFDTIPQSKYYKVNNPNINSPKSRKPQLNFTYLPNLNLLPNLTLKSYEFSWKTFQALPQYVQQNYKLKKYLENTLIRTDKRQTIKDFIKEITDFSKIGAI
jgi:hypothetical protein